MLLDWTDWEAESEELIAEMGWDRLFRPGFVIHSGHGSRTRCKS